MTPIQTQCNHCDTVVQYRNKLIIILLACNWRWRVRAARSAHYTAITYYMLRTTIDIQIVVVVIYIVESREIPRFFRLTMYVTQLYLERTE